MAGAFAHLGNSTQLKRLRKVMSGERIVIIDLSIARHVYQSYSLFCYVSGVRHLVEADTCVSKRAMLMRQVKESNESNDIID